VRKWEGTKTPSVDRMEKKNLGRTQAQPGPLLLWPINEQCMIMIQAALYCRSELRLDWNNQNIIQFYLVEGWESHQCQT